MTFDNRPKNARQNMTFVRFPSLKQPTIRYQVSQDLSETRFINTSNRLCYWATHYDTMGDGEVQHTPFCPISRDWFADFVASLADAPLTGDQLDIIRSYWPVRPDRKDIVFAMGVKYKDGKHAWYNLGDRKVSTVSSKANDRRWEQVPEWADGMPHAVFRILEKSFHDLLQRFAIYYEVRRVVSEELDRYAVDKSPSQFFGLPDDTEIAFLAADCIMRAHDLRRLGQRHLENYKR